MHTPIIRRNRGWLSMRRAAAAAAVVVVAGCAQPGTAPTMSSSAEGSFEEAVAAAIDELFAQTQPQSRLPGVLAALEQKIAQQTGGKRTVMADPVIEAGSGNQTVATRRIDSRIAERVAMKFPSIELLPYQASNVAKAQYLLTGTIGRASAAAGSNSYRIDLALTEMTSRSVTAQASTRARAQGVDTTPTAYYRDSPVLVRDQTVEQMEATSRASVGQPAPAGYIESVQSSTLVADATAAYDADRIEQALALYTQALAAPGGDQIRVHNGIYLANWRLGRVAEAEQAFGRVVATGLANRNLGVKFLFKTNSTDFWPDPKVSAPYEFWLRQIARQASASRACLNVVGHTSRTGTEQYNDQLSQRRALYIKQRLEAESAELGTRMKASGMGFRENLIGTGSDDIRDALDRRVEFKVDAC